MGATEFPVLGEEGLQKIRQELWKMALEARTKEEAEL